jgi:hypothetical protein
MTDEKNRDSPVVLPGKDSLRITRKINPLTLSLSKGEFPPVLSDNNYLSLL